MGQPKRGRTERPKEPASGPPPLTNFERVQKQDALEQRLVDGYRKIAEAEVVGKDITAWEDFWLTLLREYESVCDDIAKERTRW